MGYGDRDLDKLYPELAEAAKKDLARQLQDPPYGAKQQTKEFERRLRERNTLPPRTRPDDD